MPRTSIASEDEIKKINPFDSFAAARLLVLFQEGQTIEKVESLFTDPGDDYVDFKFNGEVICHIRGY